ncbi:MAG: iron ABC transporter permease [Enhydrobacter sp.]|nr:MAG: iron ABC transporter permease [Enhydrobacter sp.]
MMWRAGAIAIAALVALPVFGVVASLFDWRGELWAHLATTTLADIVSNTVVLLIGVGVGTTLIGTGTAWLVTMHRFPFSRTLEWALLLPLVMPTYVIGYAYADLLTFAGPIQGALREFTGWRRDDYWFPDFGNATGVALLFTLVLFPYVYLAARATFLAQSQALLDASRILGHGPLSTFRRIGLPLARPAIAAGAALALLEALADFGTVQYYGVPTFTTAIYRTWYGMGDRTGAAQIAMVLLVIAACLLLLERHSRGRRRVHVAANIRQRSSPSALSPAGALAASIVCSLPVVFGFVLPTAHLIRLAVVSGIGLTDESFVREAIHSLVLATIAALAIVALALFLAYAGRLVRRRAFNRLIEFSVLGYAIPGAVIAAGILLPLIAVDHAVDAAFDAVFGVSTGLLLSGTAFALLMAYTIRFLAVGVANVAPALAAIDPAMDASAQMLGAKPRQILRRIHLPMLKAPALTAAMLAFVEVVKELPATLLIRPFNFDTLAVGIYRYASDERLAQAAVGAVLIVAVSLAPVILLSRAIASPQPTSSRRDP